MCQGDAFPDKDGGREEFFSFLHRVSQQAKVLRKQCERRRSDEVRPAGVLHRSHVTVVASLLLARAAASAGAALAAK